MRASEQPLATQLQTLQRLSEQANPGAELQAFSSQEQARLKADTLTLLVLGRLLQQPLPAGRLKLWQTLTQLCPAASDTAWSSLLQTPGFEDRLAALYYRQEDGNSKSPESELLQIAPVQSLLTFFFRQDYAPELSPLAWMPTSRAMTRSVIIGLSNTETQADDSLAAFFENALSNHLLGIVSPVTALPSDLQPGMRLLQLRGVESVNPEQQRFVADLANTSGPLQMEARLIQMGLNKNNPAELLQTEALIARQPIARQAALQRRLANQLWRQGEIEAARQKYLAQRPEQSFAEKMHLLQIAKWVQDPAWQPVLQAWRQDPEPLIRSQALRILLNPEELTPNPDQHTYIPPVIMPQADWHPLEQQAFLELAPASQLQGATHLIHSALAADDPARLHSAFRALNTLQQAQENLTAFWPACLRLLQSPEPHKVKVALSHIGMFETAVPPPEALEQVLDALFAHPDRSVRQQRLAYYTASQLRKLPTLAYDAPPPRLCFEPLSPDRLQPLLKDPDPAIRLEARLLELASKKNRQLSDYQQTLPGHQIPPDVYNLLPALVFNDLTLKALPAEATLDWLEGFSPAFRNTLLERLHDINPLRSAIQTRVIARFMSLDVWEQIDWLQRFEIRYAEDRAFLDQLLQTSPHTLVQYQALLQLQQNASAAPDLSARVLTWLRQHGQQVSADQVSALLVSAFSQADNSLRAALLAYSRQAQPPEIQVQLLAELSHTADFKAFEAPVRQAFESESAILVLEASRLLHHHGAEISRQSLQRLLSASDPELQAIGLALVDTRKAIELLPLLEPLLQINSAVTPVSLSDDGYRAANMPPEALQIQTLEVMLRLLEHHAHQWPDALKEPSQALLNSTSPQVRQRALQALESHLSSAELQPFLTDPDAAVRLTAADAFLKTSRQKAAEALPMAFWQPFLSPDTLPSLEAHRILEHLATYPQAELDPVLQTLQSQLPQYDADTRPHITRFLRPYTGFKDHTSALQTLLQPSIYQEAQVDWRDLPTHLDGAALLKDLMPFSSAPGLEDEPGFIYFLLRSPWLSPEDLTQLLKPLLQQGHARITFLHPMSSHRMREVFVPRQHLPLLVERLTSESVAEQKAVLSLLQQLQPAAEAFEALQPLVVPLVSSKDPELSEAAISSLMLSATLPVKRQLLLQAVQTQDPALRELILHKTQDPALRPDVLAYLRQQQPLKPEVCFLLERYQLVELVPQLLNSLPAEARVEQQLLETLLMLRHAHDALSALQRLSAQAPNNLRYLLARAHLGDKSTAAPLLKLLNSGPPEAQATAIQGLAALQDSRYLAAVLPFLNRDQRAYPALSRQTPGYEVPRLQEVAEAALNGLTPVQQLPEVLEILKTQSPRIQALLYDSCDTVLYQAQESLSEADYQTLVSRIQAYLAQQDAGFKAEVLEKLGYYLEQDE